MKKILALIVAYGVISQTLANTQSATLTQDQLVEVLVDLELAKAMLYDTEDSNPNLTTPLFQEQAELIFNAHVIDKAMFQKSYFYYLADPKRLQAVYDQLIDRLEKLLQ